MATEEKQTDGQPGSKLNLLLLWVVRTTTLRRATTTQPPQKGQPATAAAAVTASTPTSPELKGPPVEVSTPHYKATFGRDGALTGWTVQRYKEEILGFGFVPEEAARKADEQHLGAEASLICSAGVDIGRQ